MQIVRSSLLRAFPHGFTTRDGGVSAPPWDRLNLGGGVGDDPRHVAENWGRLAGAAGVAFARVRQVHGARVVEAPGGPATLEPFDEADAVISDRPGVAACVSVADCVPVLLADPETGRVAAVHAGWRGTIARIAAAAVARLGAPPSRLLAAIGPSIGPCCYEVAPDLLARFRAELGEEVVGDAPTSRLDLWAANRAVLRAAGVAAERIEVLGRCTACDPRQFFSHRRDAGRTGRHAAFIAPPPPSGEGPLP